MPSPSSPGPAGSPLILAVDLGTHGPKVALVSADDGAIVDWDFAPTPVVLSPGGGAEQDPERWWQAIRTASGRLFERAGAAARARVAAICCTAQWSGTVPVDAAGRAIGNAVIWMDSRGAEFLEPMIGGLVRVEGYGLRKLLRSLRLTGGVPGRSGKDSVAHILFLKQRRPEVYRQAHKFLEPKDYLNLRLTGRFAASTDSITLHWLTDNRDLSRVRYAPSLVRGSTIDGDKLPELKRAVDVLGPILRPVADELGLPPTTQVVMGTPDVQSAAIGSCAVRDYEPHLYIGTSSWLTCHVPFKKSDLRRNMASLPSAIPDRYLIGNTQESAGACLDFLIDRLFYPDDALGSAPRPVDVYDRVERLAAGAPPGSDRLIFLPWLYGERTPVEDSTLRGALFNQTLATTRAHLARAVHEGVAYNTRWLLQAVERFAGRRFAQIDFIGGGARSALWCQILADVLDRPIRQAAEPVLCNARGAGLLGAVALGLLDFAQIPACARIAHTYEPQPEGRTLYDELFDEFLRLYRQNRRSFARLNRRASGRPEGKR